MVKILSAHIFALFIIDLNNLLKIRSVVDLNPGESGVISELLDGTLSLKLLEMGCLPGQPITMNYTAPFGDPVCVSVSGYDLSLRLDEAINISIQ
ncbi:MAG: FeoA family protein [Bacteroidota bacterium]